MKTFRLVAATPNGEVCIDVTLRGKDTADAERIVRKFLDYDCGYCGSWIDTGTERETYTVAEAHRKEGD